MGSPASTRVRARMTSIDAYQRDLDVITAREAVVGKRVSRLPARSSPQPSAGFAALNLLASGRVDDPRIGRDDVSGRIPIAVLVEANVEAIPVIDLGLRKPDLAVRRQPHIAARLFGHFLARFDLPYGKIAGAHADDFLSLYFSRHRVVADLRDLMLSVLVELCPQEIVAVVMVRILRQRDLRGAKGAGGREREREQHPSAEHQNFSIWSIGPPAPSATLQGHFCSCPGSQGGRLIESAVCGACGRISGRSPSRCPILSPTCRARRRARPTVFDPSTSTATSGARSRRPATCRPMRSSP